MTRGVIAEALVACSTRGVAHRIRYFSWLVGISCLLAREECYMGPYVSAGSVPFVSCSSYADATVGGLRFLPHVLAYDAVLGGAVHLGHDLLHPWRYLCFHRSAMVRGEFSDAPWRLTSLIALVLTFGPSGAVRSVSATLLAS